MTYWQQPCFYCGNKIKTIGLDRMNNNKGYFLKNVVSCCPICNMMKKTMDKNSFINHCIKIANKYNGWAGRPPKYKNLQG